MIVLRMKIDYNQQDEAIRARETIIHFNHGYRNRGGEAGAIVVGLNWRSNNGGMPGCGAVWAEKPEAMVRLKKG